MGLFFILSLRNSNCFMLSKTRTGKELRGTKWEKVNTVPWYLPADSKTSVDSKTFFFQNQNNEEHQSTVSSTQSCLKQAYISIPDSPNMAMIQKSPRPKKRQILRELKMAAWWLGSMGHFAYLKKTEPKKQLYNQRSFLEMWLDAWTLYNLWEERLSCWNCVSRNLHLCKWTRKSRQLEEQNPSPFRIKRRIFCVELRIVPGK